MIEHTLNHISLTITQDQLPVFFQLLMKGFKVEADLGSNLRTLLCQQLGLDRTYVDQRIQTIFLNGKAIDNIDDMYIAKDSTLALSASMPGLVGATFRKAGHYSGLRTAVSCQVDDRTHSVHKGVITIKLFNLIAYEIGPFLFEHGIWVSEKDFFAILNQHGHIFWNKELIFILNGQQVSKEEILRADCQGRQIFLRIMLKESSCGHPPPTGGKMPTLSP